MEAERKEDAERRGLPTDDIHVEPGTVDWLYGEDMPEAGSGDEENKESRSIEVEELPMIRAKGEEAGASIFSSGQGTRQKQVADIFMMEEGKAVHMDLVIW